MLGPKKSIGFFKDSLKAQFEFNLNGVRLVFSYHVINSFAICLPINTKSSKANCIGHPARL